MQVYSAAKAPYVLLLNNDTEVKEDFVEEMLAAIRQSQECVFLCVREWCSIMISDRLDDVGQLSTVHWDGRLPAARARISMHMRRKDKIFSACGRGCDLPQKDS